MHLKSQHSWWRRRQADLCAFEAALSKEQVPEQPKKTPEKPCLEKQIMSNKNPTLEFLFTCLWWMWGKELEFATVHVWKQRTTCGNWFSLFSTKGSGMELRSSDLGFWDSLSLAWHSHGRLSRRASDPRNLPVYTPQHLDSVCVHHHFRRFYMGARKITQVIRPGRQALDHMSKDLSCNR